MNHYGVLPLIFLLILVTGCTPSRPLPSAQQPPTLQSPTLPRPTLEPTISSLPKIDVAIVEIQPPMRVQPNQRFRFTITAKNMFLTGPTAGIADVEIRVRINDRMQAMDLPIGSTRFRKLRPSQPIQNELQGTAPYKAGVWTLYAIVKPIDFIDEQNIIYETTLIVG